MMLWILTILLVLLVATLLLRLRVGCHLSPEKKVAFVRLGRSGSEYDLGRKVMVIRLFGMKVREIGFEAKAKAVKGQVVESEPTESATPEAVKPKKEVSRPFSLLLEILNESGQVIWKFVVAVFRAVVVEEAEGELAFGFESPDVTGRVFGYYHAIAWVAPSVTGRVNVVPVFSGKTFSGRARVTIALPLYVLVYRVGRLVVQMPIRKIIRYARGIQKGANHGN
jgi:hypothetical protein